MHINRLLSLPVKRNSFFLFGPRQTGKTTLVKKYIKKLDCLEINLLHDDKYLKYLSRPSLLREEVNFFAKETKKPVIFIDEIQRLPVLLNEVHDLIEKHKRKITFILTGSSARKLKRVSTTNLLGGRAWSFRLHPFTHNELRKMFSLSHVLKYGTLPPILGLSNKAIARTLTSYTNTFLKEEIFDEALVRNLNAFNRFLDIAADSSGEIINYTTIGRDVGNASKTIQQYYQILEDTLIAFRLEPYLKSARKRIVKHPKYYLFDIGVINTICGRIEISPKPGTYLYGKLFEHFIVLELYRLIHYREKSWKIYFWRTSNGAEVDLVLELPDGRLLGIEIKSSDYVSPKDLTGLKQFLSDYPHAKGICVCRAEHPYQKGNISFLPWEYFFSKELKLTFQTGIHVSRNEIL